MLVDFYGELLTEKQLEVLNDYVNNDLSISEIAENKGVSRQGIHDSCRRSQQILEEYEEKLGLIEKFENVKNDISSAIKIIEDMNIAEKEKKQLIKIIGAIVEEF